MPGRILILCSRQNIFNALPGKFCLLLRRDIPEHAQGQASHIASSRMASVHCQMVFASFTASQTMLACCCAGTLLNMLGLILIGCSRQNGFNALPAGAVILGLGGITYHLAQFHISNLFPGKRGLISSLYVAGFTGCGIIFYILYEIYNDVGGST